MSKPLTPRQSRKGAALVIVLGLLVLLMGLIITFLASSGINRQTSASSANLTAVELMTSVAVNNVLGDFQDEIKDPANSIEYLPPNGGDPLYIPAVAAAAVPELELPGLDLTDIYDPAGPTGLENLIKVSTNGGLAPTDNRSFNGRRLTAERWNKPLLMQRAATDGSDDSPPAAFPTPDWIPVARDGSNPTDIADARWTPDVGTNRTAVIGRYAFTVYNQGGLLDANVAGFHADADAPIDLDGDGTDDIDDPVRYKTSAGYADLVVLFQDIGLTATEAQAAVDELTGWRNEATLANNPAENFFLLNYLNPTGFLSIFNDTATSGQTDRTLIRRQQLIGFFEDKMGGANSALMDALQYFTTFSRSTDQPMFYRMQGRDNSLPNHHSNAPVVYPWTNPASDSHHWTSMNGPGDSVFLGNNSSGEEHIVNPIIPGVTMTGSGTRFDGSAFEEGDPILKKRFPLNRVLWVTYKGPSADLPPGDPLIDELGKEGITQEFLDQGTAANIEAAFGLIWNDGPAGPGEPGGYWTYQESSSIDAIRSLSHPSQNDGVDTLGREPNFFEILRATINCGAIARARGGFKNSQNADGIAFDDHLNRDSSINNQIFQIGVNIIDQAHPDNYPTHLVLPDGGWTSRARSFWGTVDLPYMYGFRYESVTQHPSDPNPREWSTTPKWPEIVIDKNPEITDVSGAGMVIQTPLLWNPHAETPLPPGDLSPSQFRICITTSDLALPSRVGTNDVNIEVDRCGIHTGGQRFQFPGGTAHPEYYNWSPNWQANADGSDVNLGVLRFANDDPTALYFNFTPDKFRHPTFLFRPSIPTGVNLSVTSDHALASVDMNASGFDTDYSDGIVETNTGERFLGFYLGRVPLRWNDDGSNNTMGTKVARIDNNGSFGTCLTYSMEYQPPGTSDWVPYKQTAVTRERGKGSGGDFDTARAHLDADTSDGNPFGHFWALVDSFRMNTGDTDPSRPDRVVGETHLLMDPRTERWGLQCYQCSPRYNRNVSPSGPTDPTIGECWSIRHDGAMGSGYINLNANGQGVMREAGSSSKTSLIWDWPNHSDGATWPDFIPVTDNSVNLDPFYDADGVLRRPMGAWAGDPTTQNTTTSVGIPMALAGGNDDRFNKPIILHRPFRSVGELSHVFTGTAWRNIDFSTPESGYAGLLDVFCISEDENTSSLEAGKVDLNTLQKPVLKALLAGGYRDAMGDSGMPELEAGAGEAAELLAEALVNRTRSSNPGKGPLWNIAHLVGRFDPDVDIQAQTPSGRAVNFDGFSADIGINPGSGASVDAQNMVQRLREAPIRVLSNTGQANTWNLLVDIIAQTGRYPQSAGGLDDFMVAAEKRIWLHLAINRMTGKVIAQEIEVVTE